MAVPLWLHPGNSELDNVPANKNDGPLVVRSGAPRCCGVAREFPAKLTLSCGSRMPAFTLPTHKNKVEVSRYRIPYSPARTYRTVLQALPYPATSFTVLTSKGYRTLPQNMTYPATKAARNVPAKFRKYVGDRSERPVCVYC